MFRPPRAAFSNTTGVLCDYQISMVSMIPLQGALRLKDATDLPPHITRGQYLSMVDIARTKHDMGPGKRYVHMQRCIRDPILLRLMWETGGRVSDIADARISDFDFGRRLLNLRVKKTKKVNAIPLEEGTLLDISSHGEYLLAGQTMFGVNRWQIWNIVKEYGADAGLKVHPHMFRHGLAIHLLEQGVPIPVISARLGHSSVLTTMRYYLVITPEVQRQFVAGKV